MEEAIKSAIVDFLKSFTRIIVQASMYNENHPQVKEACYDVVLKFNNLLDKLKTDKLSITIFQGKVLLNSMVITSIDKLPSAMLNIYKKLNVDTIEINKDVESGEFISFSKITLSKGSYEDFLSKNNIRNILLHKEKYVRASGEEKDRMDGKNFIGDIESDFKDRDFIESLKTIISRLTDNKELQEKIISILIEKFKLELQNAIDRAVKEIRIEKSKIENDYIRTESVISNMASGEIIIDKDGNVIMSTPDAEKITGKMLKEIAGKKIFDMVNLQEQILNIAEEIKTVYEKKIKPDVRIQGKEELVNVMKKSTAVIKNEEGKIVGTIAIPPDIAKLKEVDQLKSDFISNITHELRSPLTSIKMALDLLSRQNIADNNSKVMLNTAIRNAERLNSLISDILDFSKLQSGKMIFHLEKNPANEIALDAADAMKAWATSKNIKLDVVPDPSNPYVYVDKRRTEQILINLLSNAIKFTPEKGSITVIVDSGGKADYIGFYVKDSGCGIKKEDQERIFEKFVQAASGEKAGGTGLGLAITKAMVVMQNGTITVESEVGKGSTFKVFLPVYKNQDASSEISITTLPENPPKPWWKRLFGI